MINFVVLIAVLYDLLWFINVNEQNIKKWALVISLLKEDETGQATEEPDEIMHINRDSESKYEKSDRHETRREHVTLNEIAFSKKSSEEEMHDEGSCRKSLPYCLKMPKYQRSLLYERSMPSEIPVCRSNGSRDIVKSNYTRAFGDGPGNFEPWSYRDDT
ncbi:uncharacterized protein TNCV_565501 [Trichonephila clavipes]|nr:uncharacterized protein TNCV_565501 [Trichonephila clavipes]